MTVNMMGRSGTDTTTKSPLESPTIQVTTINDDMREKKCTSRGFGYEWYGFMKIDGI